MILIDYLAASLRPDRIYGLDIETDTARGGLDPEHAPIVAVALCGVHEDSTGLDSTGLDRTARDSTAVNSTAANSTAQENTGGEAWTIVLDGSEADILRKLDDAIATLAPGVLVTWNGSRFDLPFIADRAHRIGVPIGLCLEPDAHHRSRHEPLPGHSGGYVGSWHSQRHLDAYVVYRADVGASLGLPCGLKPLSRMVGLSPVEVDRTAIHELSDEDLNDYVASDAVLARELAIRRWATAHRSIDVVVGDPSGSPSPATSPVEPAQSIGV